MKALFYRLTYGFAKFARTLIRAEFSRIRYGFAVFGGRAYVPPSDMLQAQSGQPLTSQSTNEALYPQP